MEQQGYFQIFRERWIPVVVGVVLGLGIAAALAALLPPSYTAKATLLMSVESADGTLSDRSQYSLDRIGSYPELAFSEEVLELTINDLGLNLSPEQLAGYITAVNPETTMLLQIGAEARTAQTAADVANSIATNVATVVSDIENVSGDDRFRTTLDLSNPAQPPSSPSGPQSAIILGVGLLAGLAAGLIAAIVLARTDKTVRSISQVRQISGLPVLGQIPALPHTHRRVGGKPDGQNAAAERRLVRDTAPLRETQLAIRQANDGELPRMLMLVPAGTSAGGWPEREAIARAAAATGRSVCLLEAETHASSPALQGAGMAEVFTGSFAVRDAVRGIEGERFSVLPPGEDVGAVTEKLAEERIAAVTTDLFTEFDLVIVEATSLSQPMSVELLAPYADGVVVLVRYARTRTVELAHTLARVRLAGLRPLGIVFTGVPRSRREDVVASWLPEDFPGQSAPTRFNGTLPRHIDPAP